MSVGIAVPIYACRKVLLEMTPLSKTLPTNRTFSSAGLGWVAFLPEYYSGAFPGLEL